MSSLPFLTGLIGMGITFLLVPLIIWLSQSRFMAQRGADLHHAHTTPVPRLGGIALVVAFLGIELVICILHPDSENVRERIVVLASSLAMFGLGLWDDIRPLGAKKKLLGQILIATVVCSLGIGIQTFKIPFTEKIINLGA